MSPRKRRWLGRALRVVNKTFGVTTIASSDPEKTKEMIDFLYKRYPQTKFSWEK